MDALIPRFYDRHGQPIDLSTLLRLKADPDYRFLARDVVGEVEVVTAWLGTDQLHADEPERPLIFGTVGLVRGRGSDLFENTEVFASTEAEALKNHRAVLDRARAESSP
jgi:hypothetical protein